jgi:hypothetical protein
MKRKFDIDFDGNVKALLELKNDELIVKAAMNGGGHSINGSKIIIEEIGKEKISTPITKEYFEGKEEWEEFPCHNGHSYTIIVGYSFIMAYILNDVEGVTLRLNDIIGLISPTTVEELEEKIEHAKQLFKTTI